ncbi:zinc-binding dehydrogenase [Hassallia byssoidea VB512170]|uniref:Zinc-binding dehydrogenase n=1 Tax=Hassallia byssoidea VB512170 TaxID=1304833 RepID=A0A846H8X7_9CYAN|nr:zinc-binding dehydrogenase [Hassalia byssoidea VB512170]
MKTDVRNSGKRCRQKCNYLRVWLQIGKLKPVIDRIFSLDNITEAHRYIKSNQQNGTADASTERQSQIARLTRATRCRMCTSARHWLKIVVNVQ